MDSCNKDFFFHNLHTVRNCKKDGCIKKNGKSIRLLRPFMADWAYRSAIASLSAQLAVGGVTVWGLFVRVPESVGDDLAPIFALELVSQAVEFMWYAVIVCRRRTITTWTRYIDWVVSTPIMLVSTTLFLLHRSLDASADDLFASGRLYMMLSFNWLMLSFGFAVELDALPKYTGIGLGTLAFAASFALVGTFVETSDVHSLALYVTMTVVWAMYGVAAVLPYTAKNVGYNLLDLVSKNVYGVYLTVYVLTLKPLQRLLPGP